MLDMCAEEVKKVKILHHSLFSFVSHKYYMDGKSYHPLSPGVLCWQYEKELEQLEAEINPALADDPQVALSYLFTKAIETMRSNPEVCQTVLTLLDDCSVVVVVVVVVCRRGCSTSRCLPRTFLTTTRSFAAPWTLAP